MHTFSVVGTGGSLELETSLVYRAHSRITKATQGKFFLKKIDKKNYFYLCLCECMQILCVCVCVHIHARVPGVS